MIMVIGGAFQGKTSFVNSMFSDIHSVSDGESCDFSDIFTCKIMNHFHSFIKRYLNDERLDSLYSELAEKNPDVIIISDEIGYGIVPIDQTDRFWRERTGRICCQLAASSEKVFRIVAGVPVCIKG